MKTTVCTKCRRSHLCNPPEFCVYGFEPWELEMTHEEVRRSRRPADVIEEEREDRAITEMEREDAQ